MAITFEEKSNTVRDAVIVAGMAVLLIAAGFFAWKSIQETPIVDSFATGIEFKINKEALNDSRFTSLELFPEIPPATIAVVRTNPFVEGADSEAAAAIAEKQNEEESRAE